MATGHATSLRQAPGRVRVNPPCSKSALHLYEGKASRSLGHACLLPAQPSSRHLVPHAVVAPERLCTGTTPALHKVYMAAASSQGLRKVMEDFSCLAALHPAHGVRQGCGGVSVANQHVAVAGVFDGHAGQGTAATAAEHLPHLLHQVLTGQQQELADGPSVHHTAPLEPPTALSTIMRSFDNWWATRRGRDRSGCTAVIGLVQGQLLTVGNIGDSVALLARGGSCQRLSVDHRANNAAEMMRVLSAGGEIDFDRFGTLRLYRASDPDRRQGCMFTRSLGDFNFKQPQPLLLCEPHVVQQQLCPSDKLVMLASDGVTDALGDDDVMAVAMRAVEQARNKTDDPQQLAQAAATEVMIAALEQDSLDNITAVAMLLDWG